MLNMKKRGGRRRTQRLLGSQNPSDRRGGKSALAVLRSLRPQDVEVLNEHFDLANIVQHYRIGDVDELICVLQILQELDR